MRKRYPILEFDPSRRAVIEPRGGGKATPLPSRCVLCFFREVVDKLRGKCRVLGRMGSAMGILPIYGLKRGGKTVAVMQAPVGAALAGGLLDELIARGCRKIVVCGDAGVLDSRIVFGRFVVPTSAVRDEGTSYHYLRPGLEARPGRRAVAAIVGTLKAEGLPYITGRTWTTDGFYRETPRKVALRRAGGCITVEMEAAALFAVAKFRGVELGQMLYAADDVSGPDWDKREWGRRPDIPPELFRLAVKACLIM